MTQQQLGRILNVNDSAISKYETGKIPITAETLLTLAETFDASTDYILGLSPMRHPEGTTYMKPKIAENLSEDTQQLFKKILALSPESKQKAVEYIEMLSALEKVHPRNTN